MPLLFPSLPTPAEHPCALEIVEIGLTGDTMVHGTQLEAAHQPDGTWSMDGVFDAVAPWLSHPDLMAANLETTISGKDRGYSGYPAFNSPPTILQELRDAGVDLLQTTNNHALDRGETGALRTLDALDAFQFLHTGSYRTADERQHPWAEAHLPGDTQVAFLAYTYGTEGPRPPFERWWRVSYIDQGLIAADVAAARSAGADLVVVGLHWGLQYRQEPEADQLELAHDIVGFGADVVWGTHPHVLQPAAVTTVLDLWGPRDALILYSLGNFVSNQREVNRDGGVIARLRYLRCPRHDRTWLADLTFLPVWVDDRDAAGDQSFRVLPTLPTDAACGGEGLWEDDCADMRRFRAHAAEILAAEHISNVVESPSWMWLYSMPSRGAGWGGP
jgi:poly-gamma-glutamate synthesis protein (capsule biosynthesis protein)